MDNKEILPIDIFLPEKFDDNVSSDKSNCSDFATPISKNIIVNDKIPFPSGLSDTMKLNKSPANSTVASDVKIPYEAESTSILISMLETENFESGISNPSERYFQKLLSHDRVAAMNGLSKIFMDNYSLDGRKISNLIGILHIISHNAYETIYPLGVMMAVSALVHKNKEVAEFGVKCFENWGNADGINKLKAVQFSSKWLQDYADDVIKELSEGD